jgi:hypothetical protein
MAAKRRIAQMRHLDIGVVEDRNGNAVQVRWDSEAGIVQARVFRMSVTGETDWVWIDIGPAASQGAAITAAQIWARA